MIPVDLWHPPDRLRSNITAKGWVPQSVLGKNSKSPSAIFISLEPG